jgi:hypothetical protein
MQTVMVCYRGRCYPSHFRKNKNKLAASIGHPNFSTILLMMTTLSTNLLILNHLVIYTTSKVSNENDQNLGPYSETVETAEIVVL